MSEEYAISISNVCKHYPGDVRALDGLDLKVKPGEWLSVMGPSGSGKTTLLNILDGLDTPTEGEILIQGTDVSRLEGEEITVFRREKIGLIFQQFHLLPYLTALENVMVAQYYHSMVDRDQAARALEKVQMGHRIHHRPSQLSGGEQQRVCIARALINSPQIILADEPTGNLDKANEDKVLDIFRDLHSQGKTLLVVTHDPSIAALAERTVVLEYGKIAQDYKNDIQSSAVV